MSLFISHAEADKPLVDKFVDLLQTGLSINHKAIFCTSLEGLGIPRGQTFVEFIRKKMSGATFVIMLVTPRYYESAFCLCELGATWATGQDAFPMLVPPLGFDSLKAVLTGVQSGVINDKGVLNELRDRLTKANLADAPTGRWEAKRDEFINAFKRIEAKLAGPTTVPVAQYETTKQAYDAAQKTIEDKNTEIERLEDLILKLKECKDQADVAEVMRGDSDAAMQFEQLLNEFKSLARPIPSKALEAMYYYSRDEMWRPDRGWGTKELWSDIDDAAERGFITSREDGVELNESHPKIKKALHKLQEISEFMGSDAGQSIRDSFEDTHECPFDMANRDFWTDHLDM
jgi:hypothetical protein